MQALRGIDMKFLLDHLIKESGEERDFGCLTKPCCNLLCQLGVLMSESFSERIISADDLLVCAHRLHLQYDMIDKLIVLWISRKLVERVRKKYLSSIAFSESNESENI